MNPVDERITDPEEILENWLRASLEPSHSVLKAWSQVRGRLTSTAPVQNVWTRTGGPVLDVLPPRSGIPFARITTMHVPGQANGWALAVDQTGTMVEPLMVDGEMARRPPPTVDGMLVDRATPHWVFDALQSTLKRDPVKAAGEAEALARALGARADQILEQAWTRPRKPQHVSV